MMSNKINKNCSPPSQVPVVWDETRVLKASVGEYVVVARRHG